MLVRTEPTRSLIIAPGSWFYRGDNYSDAGGNLRMHLTCAGAGILLAARSNGGQAPPMNFGGRELARPHTLAEANLHNTGHNAQPMHATAGAAG